MKYIELIKNSIYIITFIILTTCSVDSIEIDIIKIYYLPQSMTTPSRISRSGDIFNFKPVLMDTIIRDSKTIRFFEQKLIDFDTISNSIFEHRILCIIKYKNNKKKNSILSFDYYGGMNYNGAIIKDKSELRKRVISIISNKKFVSPLVLTENADTTRFEIIVTPKKK